MNQAPKMLLILENIQDCSIIGLGIRIQPHYTLWILRMQSYQFYPYISKYFPETGSIKFKIHHAIVLHP